MCSVLLKTVALISLCHVCQSYGPPRVEGKPLLLDSYLPASMQIIAHLTDLMKYELRPGGTTTTTTTVRPTPPHKPGIYAPVQPLGPEAYFARKNPFYDYVQGFGRPGATNYFDRYRFSGGEQEQAEGRAAVFQPSDSEIRSLGAIFSQLHDDPNSFYKNHREISDESRRKLGEGAVDSIAPDLDLFGETLQFLLGEANRIGEAESPDENERTENFLKNYDDSNFSIHLLRQKRIPPTRAYVSLLSLYDLLNKDSKKLGLNKYGGYADAVLKVLVDTSNGSSANQLKTVFSKIVQRKDTSDEEILKRLNGILADFEKDNSYINDALRYIPPLQFAS